MREIRTPACVQIGQVRYFYECDNYPSKICKMTCVFFKVISVPYHMTSCV